MIAVLKSVFKSNRPPPLPRSAEVSRRSPTSNSGGGRGQIPQGWGLRGEEVSGYAYCNCRQSADGLMLRDPFYWYDQSPQFDERVVVPPAWVISGLLCPGTCYTEMAWMGYSGTA